MVPLDQPHQHVKKMYGTKFQHANLLDDSPPLNKAGNKFIQEVTGVFLYLAWGVDSMMLTAFSTLASNQAAPTEKAMQKCLQFLDCAASLEDAIITYRASYMRLAIHSDSSYLSESKAHSRASSHMFMAGTEDIPINNGVVLNSSQNYDSSDVIGCRGRTRRIVHQDQNNGLNATNTWGNGTSANTHPHLSQQFNSACSTQQYNSAQGAEGHGYVIPLVTMLQGAGLVSILLETWNLKFCKILDQAPFIQPSQSILATNPNVCHYRS
jgi:hypothetical protein